MNKSSVSDAVQGCLVWLGRFERGVTGVAFLVLIVAVFLDVLNREITGTGLHWARQVGVYANVFVVMFGLGLASAGGTHLRPKFADNWLPQRFSPWLERGTDLGMALFSAAFAVLATLVVSESVQLQERSVALRMAIWPFQAVVPLAFTLAACRHLAYATWPELRPPESGALADTDVAQ